MNITRYPSLRTLTKAVDRGEVVHWKSTLYQVIPYETRGYIIKDLDNDSSMSLTSLSGALQGDIKDFFTLDTENQTT